LERKEKMKVSELIEKFNLKAFNEVYDKDINGVYISDMVSDIVAGAQPDDLLITIQTHKNLIATANLVDVSAIVMVRGKEPLPDVIELADRAGITILNTEKDAWGLAKELAKHGLE
jgi:predicted transcriptional regulator